MSENKDKSQNKINLCYTGLILSFCLSVHPNMWIQLPAQLVFIVVFILLYVFRSKAEEHSLLDNHTTYLIRSIWIGSLFFMIGFVPGCIWFWEMGDHTVMMNYMADIMGGAYLDPIEAQTAYEQMLKNYMAANQALLIKIGAITLGPSFVYIMYRFVKGFLRGVKGYRIMDVKSWW